VEGRGAGGGRRGGLTVDIETLAERARIIRLVRSFFDGRGYLELDTPLLSRDLIPESCLEVFRADRVLPGGGTEPLWLIPSPEVWMKRVIARHRASVFQVCKCFRNGESAGLLHSPEFSMLEYYTVSAGYMDSLAVTEDLVAFLSERTDGSWEETTDGAPAASFRPPFERLTVAEAFARFAGFDLFAAARTPGAMEAEARRLGLDPAPGTATVVLYDLIFIHAVEPRLRRLGPVALLDYPAFVPCLARPSADGLTVERWELYFRGIELANCFSEETDPARVRAFFESEAAEKEARALVPHAVDADYWKLFDGSEPFPRCSGVAVGLDRLIMALMGKRSIGGVLPFAL